jgi:hypothetical protein
LARHKAEPGGHIATTSEDARVIDGGHQSGRDDRTNTRNSDRSPTELRLLGTRVGPSGLVVMTISLWKATVEAPKAGDCGWKGGEGTHIP